MLQYKSIPIEIKDIDSATRTAVIAHAVYNNIDRTKDISRKGMFNKSWTESKGQIRAYLNHDSTQAPGKVVDVFEDDAKAYTRIKMGTHTLGEDTLKMLDEGIIQDASFGYKTVKSNPIEVKGEKIRELLEVKHIETSVLTCMPANPQAGVISVTKAYDEDFIKRLTDRINILEKAIRNSKASDDMIIGFCNELQNIKSILSGLDTADTQPIIEPAASENGDDVLIALELLRLRA